MTPAAGIGRRHLRDLAKARSTLGIASLRRARLPCHGSASMEI